jgi:hypothetical protein
MEIVFSMARGWGSNLTHATDNLAEGGVVGPGAESPTEVVGTTLCGKDILADWYGDAWADGPECKQCQAALARLGQEQEDNNDE